MPESCGNPPPPKFLLVSGRIGWGSKVRLGGFSPPPSDATVNVISRLDCITIKAINIHLPRSVSPPDVLCSVAIGPERYFVWPYDAGPVIVAKVHPFNCPLRPSLAMFLAEKSFSRGYPAVYSCSFQPVKKTCHCLSCFQEHTLTLLGKIYVYRLKMHS